MQNATRSLASALLLAGLAAAPALSQDVAPEGAPGASAPEIAPQAEGPPPGPPPPEPSREEKLDALFAELAATEHEDQATRIANQIRRLWARSDDDTANLLLDRGRRAMENEDPVKALHHFSAAVEFAPDFAEAWNLRATAFYMKGDWSLALRDIERVLELEPRHFSALTGLGVILQQLDREADAIVAFRRALEINPHIEPALDAVERLAPRVDGRDI